MKETAAFLCIIIALVPAGCGRAPTTAASETELHHANPAFIFAPLEKTPVALTDLDKESFLYLLDSAAKQQPCTAGSSLRLASLGGGLLSWLEDHPGQQDEALRLAGDWAEYENEETLWQTVRTFRLLRECALRMGEEELRSLLDDAGCSWMDQGPAREAFLCLVEGLTRELDADYSEISKKNAYFSVKSLQTVEKRVMILDNTRNMQRMIQ